MGALEDYTYIEAALARADRSVATELAKLLWEIAFRVDLGCPIGVGVEIRNFRTKRSGRRFSRIKLNLEIPRATHTKVKP